MIKGFSVIKKYYSLVKVKPFFIVLEFITLLIPAGLSIITPVISADIITSLTVYDFGRAITKLTANFVIVIISAISYFLYHVISSKVNRNIIFNINNYVYKNVKENKNISSVSASVFDNISECADFNKSLLYKTCFFIKSIVLLCIIAYYNVILGLVLVGVSIVSFLFLKLSDKKIQQHSKNYSKYQSEALALFNNIQQGDDTGKTYNIEETLKDKYFKYIETNIKTKNRISLYYNINNNFISMILKATVFVATIYLIGLVKSTTLTLSLYLILTPYLTSSAQNLISFFELFSELAIVENLLSEFDALAFITEQKQYPKIELNTYNLYFFNTTCQGSNSKIKNLELKISHGKVVTFVGDSGSGKRTIFELLKRSAKPDSGMVLLDSKNIFDIEPSLYSKTVTYTTSKPYLYNVSISENLYMVCPNKRKINTELKAFGIKAETALLPEKENTIISYNSHPNLAFFVGILRSFLTGAKIISIYEIPPSFTAKDYNLLKKIVQYLKKYCTILFFTHNDDAKSFSDSVLYIENGEIKNKNV